MGPHRAREVGGIGDQRGCDAHAERVAREVAHRARARLREERHRAGERGEREQRQLLHDELPRSARRARRRRRGWRETRAAERPDIEEQEQERQADGDRLGGEREEVRAERCRAIAGPGAPHPADPRGGGTQRERAGEQLLALRDPRHRLDARRVQRERRRGESGRPERAGRRAQHAEQEQNVQGVQRRVHRVRAPGLDAEHLHVEHVREPRERNPVAGVEARERARDTRARKPAAHDRVLQHVDRVVELDEVEARHRAIGPRDRDHERRRDRELAAPRRRNRSLGTHRARL